MVKSFIIGGTQVLTLVGTASSATAVTGILTSGIQFVDITNRGRNYTFAPRVAISSAPTGGTTGIATAVLRGELLFAPVLQILVIQKRVLFKE